MRRRFRSIGLAAIAVWMMGSVASFGDEPKASNVASPQSKPLYSPEQFKRLGERDDLIDQKDQLLRDGKLADAATALEKMVAIDREVLGDEHCDTFRALEGVARIHALDNNQSAAKRALANLTDLQNKGYGAGTWRTVDVRLVTEFVNRLGNVNNDQRVRLQKSSRDDDSAAGPVP